MGHRAQREVKARIAAANEKERLYREMRLAKHALSSLQGHAQGGSSGQSQWHLSSEGASWPCLHSLRPACLKCSFFLACVPTSLPRKESSDDLGMQSTWKIRLRGFQVVGRLRRIDEGRFTSSVDLDESSEGVSSRRSTLTNRHKGFQVVGRLGRID